MHTWLSTREKERGLKEQSSYDADGTKIVDMDGPVERYYQLWTVTWWLGLHVMGTNPKFEM